MPPNNRGELIDLHLIKNKALAPEKESFSKVSREFWIHLGQTMVINASGL